MERPQAGAVLFVRDLPRLTDFYRHVAGLALAGQDDDHTVLTCPGFELIVHRIPDELAGSIAMEAHPRRRERGTIKLCFAVASLEHARATARSLGGVVDPPEDEWAYRGWRECAGHDPEGNVFQLRCSR